MTLLSSLKKHDGWWFFALAISAYLRGIHRLPIGKFDCDSIDRSIAWWSVISVALGAMSCAELMRAAIVRRSFVLRIASLAVALFMLIPASVYFNNTSCSPLLGCADF